MRYLLDTNLLSKQDTHPKVRNWILQHQLQIGIASLTVAEIAQGIEALPPGKRRSQLELFLKEMLEDYPVISKLVLAWLDQPGHQRNDAELRWALVKPQ